MLRILVAKAAAQGQTLTSLAKELGVTYSRLTQWRREKFAMRSAHRSVHLRAARYLGVPTALTLALAGVVGLEDFIWPESETLEARLRRDIEEMRHDPHVAAFLPSSLAIAAPELQLLIVFLYRQLKGVDAPQREQPWLAGWHRAVVELRGPELRTDSGKVRGVF